MARRREICPGFFTNEELTELPPITRLLFAGLWTEADREGRLEDRPRRLKMRLFPADDFDLNAALNDLQSAGFIERYEVGTLKLIQITNFRRYQHPHPREAKSMLPARQDLGMTKAVPRHDQGMSLDMSSRAGSSIPSIPSNTSGSSCNVGVVIPDSRIEPDLDPVVAEAWIALANVATSHDASADVKPNRYRKMQLSDRLREFDLQTLVKSFRCMLYSQSPKILAVTQKWKGLPTFIGEKCTDYVGMAKSEANRRDGPDHNPYKTGAAERLQREIAEWDRKERERVEAEKRNAAQSAS